MAGRAYYLSTLGAWRRIAGRCICSHWAAATPAQDANVLTDACPVLTLIEGDEGLHLALERDVNFEALPPALSGAPVSVQTAEALAGYGITAGATTLDVARAVGSVHPLLAYRVF